VNRSAIYLHSGASTIHAMTPPLEGLQRIRVTCRPFFPKDANTLPVTTTFQFKYWPDADPLRSVQNPTRSTGNEHGAVREQADNEDSDE